MIPAFLYKYIFLFIVTVMTMTISAKYKRMSEPPAYLGKESGNILLVFFLILFFGFRPLSGMYFGDMANYYNYYNMYLEGSNFSFDIDAANLLFDNYFAWVGSMRLGVTFFFVTIAAIYFGAAYLGIRRLFPKHKLAAYLVFLAAFSTFSYATNGIKAGAAASLFIWAMSYREKLWVCIPLVLLSWGFHHSMQLPVFAFIVTLFFKDARWYYYGWAFCMIMAILHVDFFASLFAGYTDESGANYLIGEKTEDAYVTGFRLDFILYSAAPVVIGYYTEIKRKLRVSPLYRDLIHLYLCINGVWMLCMYASYTNRIAYLSWFLYPIVLIYPFLHEDWGPNKYRYFAKTMNYHLCFTLFMEIVFYGILA